MYLEEKYIQVKFPTENLQEIYFMLNIMLEYIAEEKVKFCIHTCTFPIILNHILKDYKSINATFDDRIKHSHINILNVINALRKTRPKLKYSLLK
jgi:hypothetical protein